MSGFSPWWLSLREAADARARDEGLTRVLAERIRGGDRPRVLDLGAGTGANLRFLAPRLGTGQQWQLIDNDPDLLERLPEALVDWARAAGHRVTRDPDGLSLEGVGFTARVGWQQVELAADPAAWLPAETDLVTASAWLDLVSKDWIDALSLSCRRNGCMVLFALSYDGRMEWHPALTADATVRDRLNRHQRRDKGLGPALGPDAVSYAAARLAALGFDLRQAFSDWHLGPDEAALQRALAAGWAQAAVEIDPSVRTLVDRWLNERAELLDRRASRLMVGNRDLLAFPAGRRSEQS